jgi:hypothetical protein
MHTLEFMLFALSHRVRAGEIKRGELADTLLSLASSSHEYVPETENAEKRLATSRLNKNLHRWFDRQQDRQRR